MSDIEEAQMRTDQEFRAELHRLVREHQDAIHEMSAAHHGGERAAFAKALRKAERADRELADLRRSWSAMTKKRKRAMQQVTKVSRIEYAHDSGVRFFLDDDGEQRLWGVWNAAGTDVLTREGFDALEDAALWVYEHPTAYLEATR